MDTECLSKNCLCPSPDDNSNEAWTAIYGKLLQDYKEASISDSTQRVIETGKFR